MKSFVSLIGWLIIVFWVIPLIFSWLKSLFEPAPPGRTQTRAPSPSPAKPQSKETYRPSLATARSPIKFGANQPGNAQEKNASDLTGINDAFSGRLLDTSQPIYECESCHVFYQGPSVEVLKEANSSKCMVCGSTHISLFGKTKPTARARNHTPELVTLQNYRQHIGRVITFTGFVHEVKVSRRGTDYAVMFERASWSKGLKMVAFRGGAKKIGEARIRGFASKTLTIRGLLIIDPTFGPEIIVHEPSMIVDVR